MSASRCIETSLFYQKTLKFTIVWQKRDWNFLTSGRYCILKIGKCSDTPANKILPPLP